MENNKKIIFDLPEGTVLGDIFDEILKKNNLEETTEDFFTSIRNNQEPRVIILIDATKIIFQKKLLDEKIIELLQKHLKVSKEIAEKVVNDIKQKVIPYVKEVLVDEEGREINKKLSTQDFILEKIRKNMPVQQSSFDKNKTEQVKKVETTNVEENAKNLGKEDKGKQDTYRETIE